VKNKTFEIEIEIDPEGGLKSTVKGIKGKSCAAASSFLDDMGKVLVDEHTKEAFEQATNIATVQANR
jgi:hypothetical protein